MEKIKSAVLIMGAGLLVSLNLLHAAPTRSSAQPTGSGDLSAMVAAVSQTTPIPAEEVPPVGTFYSAQNPGGPPLPGDMNNLPAWNLGNNMWLLDDLDYDYSAPASSRMSMSRSMSMDAPSPGDGGTNGGGDYSPMFSGGTPIDTNGLYLELTNVANGWSYLNLHNATNQVYSIWSTTNLSMPFANGNVELELWPSGDQTNVLPFSVQNLNRNPLFLRAEDWTGVDSDGDGVPDWWIWQYFGNLSETATNLDAGGNTLGYDYTNNIAPAVFNFSGVEVANNYFNASSAAAQLDVSGSPYYMAIAVDNTNYENDADWQVYTSSNITVNLGLTEGWHDVWIGLRGHADNVSAAVWQWNRLKLDYTAPQIVITNPVIASGTATTVDKPIIQLQGFANEALAHISYDLTNALGLVTNQLAMVEGQAYSTNTWEFTTNYFQCFDVPLTNGLNVITLHATDLTGNVTTTNFSFTLDYSAKTNAPVVQLFWPQDGMEIVGSNIVCRGQVSDPTATVTVQLVDATGATNNAGSLVGRDGLFYAGNLTLATGTNYLSYTVTDAAGNVSTTNNITVATSDLGLTLDTVVAGQTLVTGTIDDDSYTVYVNGVEATNDGFGNWSATITPIGIGGGAVVVNAVNGGDPTLQQMVAAPQGVFVSAYHESFQSPYPFDSSAFWTLFGDVFWDYDNLNWENGQGGTGETLYTDGAEITFPVSYNSFWPANNWPQPLPDGTKILLYWDYDQYNATTTVVTNQYEAGTPGLGQEHCDTYNLYYFERRTADTEMKLATGGPNGSTAQNLWCLSGGATDRDTGHAIPFEQISIGGFGNLDTNGELWVVLSDNDPVGVTPDGHRKNYTFGVGATKFHPYIKLNGASLDYGSTIINCVGQGLTFSIGWSPYTPDEIADTTVIWSLPGTFVNTNSDPNCDLYYSEDGTQLHRTQSVDGTTATSCWYVKDLQNGTANVIMNVTLKDGQQKTLQASGQFTIVRPTTAEGSPYQPDGTPTAQILGGSLSLGVSGVTNDMSFQHTVNPGDFSGQAGYVQVINSGDIETYPPISPINNALDAAFGEFPADRQSSVPANATTTLNKFYDAPSVGLPSSDAPVSEDVSFSAYLMFQPPGGIWVPLRLITWELHDHADPAWTPHNSNGLNTTKITGDNPSTAFPDWTTHFP